MCRYKRKEKHQILIDFRLFMKLYCKTFLFGNDTMTRLVETLSPGENNSVFHGVFTSRSIHKIVNCFIAKKRSVQT